MPDEDARITALRLVLREHLGGLSADVVEDALVMFKKALDLTDPMLAQPIKSEAEQRATQKTPQPIPQARIVNMRNRETPSPAYIFPSHAPIFRTEAKPQGGVKVNVPLQALAMCAFKVCLRLGADMPGGTAANRYIAAVFAACGVKATKGQSPEYYARITRETLEKFPELRNA